MLLIFISFCIWRFSTWSQDQSTNEANKSKESWKIKLSLEIWVVSLKSFGAETRVNLTHTSTFPSAPSDWLYHWLWQQGHSYRTYDLILGFLMLNILRIYVFLQYMVFLQFSLLSFYLKMGCHSFVLFLVFMCLRFFNEHLCIPFVFSTETWVAEKICCIPLHKRSD